MLYAEHKYLFIDPTKFKIEGEKAYGIAEILKTATMVTIYTVSGEEDAWIEASFHKMCSNILAIIECCKSDVEYRSVKYLRLQIVGQDAEQSKCITHRGLLRNE
jgi:hypothetical protein